MKAIKSIIIILLIVLSGTIQGQGHSTGPKIHTVIVLEILQVSSYSYLRVMDENDVKWLAVPTVDAEVGDTLYYKGGMEMFDFESKEMNRTFDVVIFLQSIGKTPDLDKKSAFTHSSSDFEKQEVEKPSNEKLALNLEPVDGAITIAELFKNKKKYEGKLVRIKGQVTKYNAKVMSKNWIHLQDGTEYKGDYDLTLTTSAETLVGDTILIEGKVYLDKDFGYGYFYKLIIENAVIIE
jgi:hypothetical protein